MTRSKNIERLFLAMTIVGFCFLVYNAFWPASAIYVWLAIAFLLPGVIYQSVKLTK
jgi:hypothetical protein